MRLWWKVAAAETQPNQRTMRLFASPELGALKGSWWISPKPINRKFSSAHKDRFLPAQASFQSKCLLNVSNNVKGVSDCNASHLFG